MGLSCLGEDFDVRVNLAYWQVTAVVLAIGLEAPQGL